MEADYPAAHSMDTRFFAVDQRGQVAVFDTGENGHAPDTVSDPDEYHELTDLLLGQADDDRYRPPEEEADLLRLFYYDYLDSFDPIGPYERVNNPATPLHIDQLPPRFREQCARVKLNVRFDQAETVQPLEQYPCVYWYSDRVAYLCADGRTVRPIPGQEGAFADFVRRLRTEAPEEAAKYRFVGPTE